MKTFIYEAHNSNGALIRGLLRAESRTRAIAELKSHRFRIRSVHERNEVSSTVNRLLGVNQTVLAIFTRELATMFKAGLPLLKCLEILACRGENPRLEDVVLLVQEHIKAGDSLYQAISRFPDVFSPVYLALVQSGEISGQLGEVLERLALYLERDSKLRQKAKAAMSYPLVVFAFCIALSVGLIVFIFPKFIELFQGLSVNMPWPTRILIFLVTAVKNPYVLIALFIASGSATIVLIRYVHTTVGRRHFHQWLLTLPILGDINRKIAVSRFCRTFSTLFSSGITVLRALDVVSHVSGNDLINEAIEHVREAVKYGSSISVPLEESALFPIMVTSMIQVGEQSGYLQTMLNKIADYYESEVDLSLTTLSKLLEPVLIGIMGVIVGFVLIAVFLPIYQLIGGLSR